MTGRHGYSSESPPLYHGGSHTAIQLPPGRKKERNGSTTGGGDDDDDYMTTACIYLPTSSLSTCRQSE